MITMVQGPDLALQHYGTGQHTPRASGQPLGALCNGEEFCALHVLTLHGAPAAMCSILQSEQAPLCAARVQGWKTAVKQQANPAKASRRQSQDHQA